MKKTNKVLKLMLAVVLSFGFSTHANSETVEGSDKFVTLEQFEVPQKYIKAEGAEDLNLEEKTELSETSVRISRETGLSLIEVFGTILAFGGSGMLLASIRQDIKHINFLKKNPPGKLHPYYKNFSTPKPLASNPYFVGTAFTTSIAGIGLLIYSSTAKAATMGEYFLTEEGFDKFLEMHQTDEEVRNALARHTDFRDGLVEQFYAVKGFLEEEEIRVKTEKSEFIFPLLPIFIDYYKSTF